jgi:predicted transcriptional regulator
MGSTSKALYFSGMAQVTSSISDELNQLLSELAEETGIPKSSLIAEYIRRGVYEDVRAQAEVRKFRQDKDKGSKGAGDKK